MTHRTSDGWPISWVTSIISIIHTTCTRERSLYNRGEIWSNCLLRLHEVKGGVERFNTQRENYRSNLCTNLNSGDRHIWAKHSLWTTVNVWYTKYMSDAVFKCWWFPCVVFRLPHNIWRATRCHHLKCLLLWKATLIKEKKIIQLDGTLLIWGTSVGNKIYEL